MEAGIEKTTQEKEGSVIEIEIVLKMCQNGVNLTMFLNLILDRLMLVVLFVLPR
jgi:hypothetical protein